MERARSFPGQEKIILKHYQENPRALDDLRAPLFEEKVVDLILSEAAVTDKLVSIEALMKAPEEDAAAAFDVLDLDQADGREFDIGRVDERRGDHVMPPRERP